MVRCILFLISDKRERKRNFFIYSLIWTKSIGLSEKLRRHAKIADFSSVSPSSNRSDEGLTLETSAFLLFTVANLRFQLSC